MHILFVLIQKARNCDFHSNVSIDNSPLNLSFTIYIAIAIANKSFEGRSIAINFQNSGVTIGSYIDEGTHETYL